MSIIVAERFLNNDAFRCDDGQRKEILRFGFQSSHEEYQNGIRFYHGNLIPHLHQVCGAAQVEQYDPYTIDNDEILPVNGFRLVR